jgi:hypothetical protein
MFGIVRDGSQVAKASDPLDLVGSSSRRVLLVVVKKILSGLQRIVGRQDHVSSV